MQNGYYSSYSFSHYLQLVWNADGNAQYDFCIVDLAHAGGIV